MCKKCLNILIKNSESKDWEIGKLEWTGHPLGNDDPSHCICGKLSLRCFLLTNTKNYNKLILGRVCILDKKFNIFNGNEQIVDLATSIWCNDCDKNINYSSLHSHNNSDKHIKNKNDKINEIILREELDKIRMEEEKIKMNNRKCQKCELFKIPKNKPAKNIFCVDCFMSFIAKNSNCPDCNCKITDKQFNTYKRCYDCCLKNRIKKNY